MRSPRSIFYSLAVLALFGSSAIAKADDLVFSLDQTMLPQSFTTGNGVAQAVDVTSTTSIDSFGFYLSQRTGGDVDYFIYDETTSSMVLDPTAVATEASPKTWDMLTGIDVTLDAGNEYLFGVYGDNTITVGMDPTTYSSIGLSLPTSGPDSYNVSGDTIGSALSGTINQQGFSTDDVGLRIDDPPPPVPEPSSLVLLGTGILAAAGAMRSRLFAR
jgi:hypothetical protein